MTTATHTTASPALAPASVGATQPARTTHRLTRGLALLALLVGLAWIANASLAPMPFDIAVDGKDIFSGTNSTFGERFVVIAAMVAAAFVVLLLLGLLLPVILIMIAGTLVLAGLAVLGAVGLPVLLAALALLLVASPLLLVGWLLVKLLT